MRRLVEAPLKDFSKDLENGAKFPVKLHITATEDQEQAAIYSRVTFICKTLDYQKAYQTT